MVQENKEVGLNELQALISNHDLANNLLNYLQSLQRRNLVKTEIEVKFTISSMLREFLLKT